MPLDEEHWLRKRPSLHLGHLRELSLILIPVAFVSAAKDCVFFGLEDDLFGAELLLAGTFWLRREPKMGSDLFSASILMSCTT